MAELLEINELTLSYRTSEGPLPAVRGVDLVVRAGEVVGVAGESGCGKSSMVSTVLRLQPKDATVTGSVLVSGVDALTVSWGDLRALRWADASIVFQGALHSLNPVHRVGDQIAEPIRLHEPDLPENGSRSGCATCWSRSACPGPGTAPTRTSSREGSANG
jgi:ABC-type glutathione transport system ATPase component